MKITDLVKNYHNTIILLQVRNSFGANLYIIDSSCRALLTDPDIATALHDNHWDKYSGSFILINKSTVFSN